MSRDNLCAKLNDGDIVFFGDERFQVFKANKKCRVERVAVYGNGARVSTLSDESFLAGMAQPPKPGDKFNFGNGYSGTFHGFVTTATRTVKTVPVLFSGGELPVRQYRDRAVMCLLDDDEEVYRMLTETGYRIDLTFAAIVPAQCGLQKPADIKGFTKFDLIAYVIEVNGEGKFPRQPIMKKVAYLEGKPWIPTSNTDYFLGVSADANTKGTLRKAAKGKHGRILYGLGAEGKERANRVLARLGPELGRI